MDQIPKHNYALALENYFRRKFHYEERGGMGGLIDADHLEYEPVITSVMLLSSLFVGKNIDDPEYDKIKKFILKYSPIMNKKMHEMTNIELESFVKDVKSVLD